MRLRSQPRYRWEERPSNKTAGIYAYFIERADKFRSIALPADGLLYIGMTDSSLDARCHFEHAHSGFSTFRRSLGAILKLQLQLRALPRAHGPSRTNVLSYRFDADGEHRLTEWMRQNLNYANCEIAAEAAKIEREAIRVACPPLNLVGWQNPQRSEIRRLRALCVAEAKIAGRH